MKRLLLLFIIHFCFSSAWKAQEHASPQKSFLDSLKIALNETKNDTVACRILSAMIEAEEDDNVWPAWNDRMKEICETNLKVVSSGSSLHRFYLKYLAETINNQGYLANIQGDIPKALELYEKSLKIDQSLGDKKGISTSFNNIGSLYQYQGQIDKALDYYAKSLALREEIKDPILISESLNNIGLLYGEKDNIPAALNLYHKGLKIQEQINDKKGMATTLNNIGIIYLKQDDSARALHYFTKSSAIQEEIGDTKGLAGSLHNIGNIYSAGDNMEKALQYFTRSYRISEASGNKSGMAHCLNSMGTVYNKLGEPKRAVEYWSKGLKLREEINEVQEIALSLNNLSGGLIMLGDIQGATRLSERSLKLAYELGFPNNIRTASGSLSQLYSKSGNWQKAYEMLLLYKKMNDTINDEEGRKAALQMSFQYEYEKKTAADSIKAVEQRKVFDAQLQQQKTQRTALYIGIALIALFAFFMYNRFRVTQKQKHIIELKEKETQQQKYIIEQKHKEISDSINYAERIQRTFLATDDLLKKYLSDYFILYLPKDIVSGDFYWASILRNHQFALAVADSTGHGVPGAIMSLLNITSLEKAVESHTDPAEILNHTRRTIIERLKKDGSSEGGKDGMDCSLLIFDFNNLKLKVAAANNAVWIVKSPAAGGDFIETGFDKMPVGRHDKEQTSFSTHDIDLQAGDMIYAISDGFADQFGGPRGKKFMNKRLKELLISITDQKTEEQKQVLLNVISEWMSGHEQVDDITIVGIRV